MLSVLYHDIFDYPLKKEELQKWKSNISLPAGSVVIKSKNGYYFIVGREKTIEKRLQNEKESKEKFEIAKRAARILGNIPTIKLVAITGSLAMNNSSKKSDIDLMIITKNETLWTSRIFVYMVIHAFGLRVRKPNDWHQDNRICLNIWLDEDDLIWPKNDRNLYTAHEIAQIVPLVNKNNTYEKFLYLNRWILSFWPYSIKIKNLKLIKNLKFKIKNSNYIEKVCYWVQYNYMKSKITREVVNPTRALFHPKDWGKVVLDRLSARL